MRFSDKYADFIKHDSKIDFMEGTTYSGKSTVGMGVKLMLKIADSPKKFHFIAGKDLGTVEKNIINAEKGILKVWGGYVRYWGNGTAQIKLPHIQFTPKQGTDKIIYVFGYDDKARWQKILGGQFGCGGIDEANIADIDFIHEVSIRCDYMLWTFNPDNPDLPIYDEYVNHARPINKYINDYPDELLGQLNQDHKPGYLHWYFTFNDNISCTPEKRQQIIDNAPPGTKLHKNKILGLRGVGEGALYAGYMHDGLLVDYNQVNTGSLVEVVASVDMGTNTGQQDTKHAHTVVTVTGFSQGYQRVVVLESKVIPSLDIDYIVEQVDKLLMPYWANYYRKLTKIAIDYGDSGDLLIRSWKKRTRLKNVNVKRCIKTGSVEGVAKAINLQSRAQLKCQLLMGEYLLWTNRAVDSFKAHRNILSTEDGAELEQSNIDNDYGDSLTYTLTENWVRVSKLTKGVEL